MSLFQYTYGDGRSVVSDSFPTDDTGIVELILNRDNGRFARDNIRAHISHPVHEAAMKTLPPALRILRAPSCKLRTWPELPTSIEECYLSRNHYLRLPDLSSYTRLIVLELDDNSIEEIKNPLPPRLARLNLDSNALRTGSVNRSLIPVSCANISSYCNPSDIFGHQRTARVFAGAAIDDEPKPANIYVNNHNVHDSGVQKSTKANILYLVNYRNDEPENPNLWKSINAAYSSVIGRLFSNTSQLPGSILESYGKNPYIMHGVTFTHLVDRVWLRIQDIKDNENKKELLQRFKEEVEDGNHHCTNGMMVRISNVFLGFDENIVVRLNTNQILSARIPATQERLRKSMGADAGLEGAETPAFWIAVYNETIKDLKELEVNKAEEYESWLLPLSEPVLDDLFEKQGWNNLSKSSRPPEDSDDPEVMTLRKYIRESGLKGFNFELKYLLELWN